MNRFLALGSLLLAATPLASRAGPPPDFAPLAAFIQQTKDATTLPSGTAIAVIKNGKVVYEGYFGYSDIQARTPVTRDTVFYIASATKPFFALNALLQEDAGRLDMRMSLHDMFPEGRFTGIDANAVTVKDLLVHTSGVDNQPLVWATAYSGIHDEHSLLGLVSASYPDEKAARGTFKYTNVGYNILSVWLDRRGPVPWQEQLERSVLRPLGMRRTSASIGKAEAAGWALAKPYSFASARPRQPLPIAKSDATMHAAGGLVSTAPDLAKFLIAELASGQRQAIPRKVIRRSHEPQVALTAKYMDFQRTGYAWGWYTGEYKGRTMLHHFGGFAGFHAHLSFMPDEGIALVVLNNEDVLGAQMTSLIADYVYGSLLGEPDVASTVSRRFDALRTKAAEASPMAARQREAIQARAWALSRPRTEYAGTYSNELSGDMTVHLDEDRGMVIRWGNVQAVATGGEAPDRVRVAFAPNSGDFLDFRTENGVVTAISFERMVFRKSPGEG
ncbi:CubicO group peptidase (beta-lactamase class C family) [Luteibacter jiangsuensis]|uniref:CubicO group peptidase (Beta-lactamase class C family) n=1 Tax=Luteibacter jiangsuensis TaxID=637577 RepID=A0ABT9ST57_9GAMM|nr:serine hydrolase domain-containing protein [Luteibacter jiangsuensis]MDQ0008178.1 CubicO group peptidase (beta-lactamase class C family) [Luteibacter jiangsuensis]